MTTTLFNTDIKLRVDYTIEMLNDFVLPNIYKQKLLLKQGDIYTVKHNFGVEKYGRKNWWIVSGNYFDIDTNGIVPGALSFSNKELKSIEKIFKQLDII